LPATGYTGCITRLTGSGGAGKNGFDAKQNFPATIQPRYCFKMRQSRGLVFSAFIGVMPRASWQSGRPTIAWLSSEKHGRSCEMQWNMSPTLTTCFEIQEMSPFASLKITGSKRKRSSKKFPRHAGNSTSLNLFQREMSRVFRSLAIG
jgi:hypothetical protein